MRAILLMLLLTTASCTDDQFGIWKMDPARSTSRGEPLPKSFTVRIEPHAKGEVFTVDRIFWDGRASTSSIILYLDGKSRDFLDQDCSGTQSSRQVDKTTVEMVRNCNSGTRSRIVRRFAAQPKELILDITKQLPDSRRLERHLVLDKQQEGNMKVFAAVRNAIHLFMLIGRVSAQAPTGVIAGTVRDPSSAAVVGAQIKAVSVATGLTRIMASS
jgi:hypothetical protein